MIHLVFKQSAAASLRHSFRKGSHQIIAFPIDFSVGPITNIHTNSGINHYFSWLKSSYQTVWSHFEEEDQYLFRQALQKLLEIKDGENVTIWTCENATEQIALRICCHLLKEKQVKLTFINTFKALQDYTKQKDYRMYIRHTGECNAELLAHFYKNSIYTISEDVKRNFEQEGEKLLNCKSLLRSWQLGKIVDEPESREDPFIIKCARRIHAESQNQEYIDAIRLVGIVLGESRHTLSDAWIEYRVRSLIHSGQLKYVGDLQSMHTYKVKIVKS